MNFYKLIQETINKYLLVTEESDIFVPTEEWMLENYVRLNKELFNNYLGSCKLIPYSKKNTNNILGCFRMNGHDLKVNLQTRQIFQQQFWGSQISYVDRYSFEDICEPSIELNTRYKATEEAWLNVLVHEMCHYYTYCDGYSPKQGHGREFREIAETISIRSNGRFTVQRVATAEQMTNFDLEDVYQQKEDAKLQKLAKSTNIVIGISDKQEMRLTTTSSPHLIAEILALHRKRDDMVFLGTIQNEELYKFLASKNYVKNFRTYRYWDITNETEIINELSKYNINNLLKDGCSLQEAIEFMKHGGDVFVTKHSSVQEHIKYIVNSVIKEVVENSNIPNEEFIDITPNDELGLYSPLEKNI